MTLLDHATEYLRRGWLPVPIPAGTKIPVLDAWQKLRLTEAELPAHFGNGANIGLILGEPSGGLVNVDKDCPEAIELGPLYLPPTPAVSGRPSTPTSHDWYYAEIPKTRQFRDPVTNKMIVELRSTGGQTIVGPSIHPEGEQYLVLTGEPARVSGPMLEACVEALYKEVVKKRYPKGVPKPKPKKKTAAAPTAPREQTADVLERRAIAYLDKTPPAISGQGGHNQTYVAAVALVHGFCFSPDHALQILLAHYNPRCQPPWTEKELQHKVDDAATKPHDKPYGWLRDANPDPPPEANDVDISALLPAQADDEGDDGAPDDPGPIPESLLRVPGFVSEVMDFCLAISPYPSTALAFCGAITLQSFLAGRKVRDPSDIRTNLYLLALAHASVGKDHPRKVNARILFELGLTDCLGDKFASGEGIQDALFINPSILFQNDEIDGILRSINKSRDARHEAVMGTLLTMYTSSASVYPMRRKAGKTSPGVIDQPHLTLFGTAVPRNYYEALSERMLTNGLFARMIIVDVGKRSDGQEAGRLDDIPPRVMDTARWWKQFMLGEHKGNLEHWHPIPAVVEYTDEAQPMIVDWRRRTEAEYGRSEDRNDEVSMTVWGRVCEHTRKLALLYAVSENHESPVIGADAVRWALEFMDHQTRRMLFMASQYVSKNEFDAMCKELLRELQKWKESKGDEWMEEWRLNRKLSWKPKDHEDVRNALMAQKRILYEEIQTKTRPRKVYKLL